MKFGLFAQAERHPRENWSLGLDLDIEEMKTAERLGFDEFWAGEHHAIPHEASADPLLLLAKGAAETERITLAPGVIQAPVHDPFKTAERLAQLDHLSHGRLLYGIGGSAAPELDFFGLPSDEKRPRMKEFIDIVETYHTADGPVAYDGDFWQYDDREIMLQPYQRPHPRVAIPGSTSPYSFELAARREYIPMSISYSLMHGDKNPKVHSLTEQAETMRETAREVGRDPEAPIRDWRIFREVYVAESREQAIADIRSGATETFLDYLRDTAGLGIFMKEDEDMADEEITLEYLIDNAPWIVGSPEECIEQIEEMRDELGDFGALGILSRKSWMPTDMWYRSLERFARYVMPAFKENTRSSAAPDEWR